MLSRRRWAVQHYLAGLAARPRATYTRYAVLLPFPVAMGARPGRIAAHGVSAKVGFARPGQVQHLSRLFFCLHRAD
jgi:hypothetical protein